MEEYGCFPLELRVSYNSICTNNGEILARFNPSKLEIQIESATITVSSVFNSSWKQEGLQIWNGQHFQHGFMCTPSKMRARWAFPPHSTRCTALSRCTNSRGILARFNPSKVEIKIESVKMSERFQLELKTWRSADMEWTTFSTCIDAFCEFPSKRRARYAFERGARDGCQRVLTIYVSSYWRGRWDEWTCVCVFNTSWKCAARVDYIELVSGFPINSVEEPTHSSSMHHTTAYSRRTEHRGIWVGFKPSQECWNSDWKTQDCRVGALSTPVEIMKVCILFWIWN